MIVAVGGPPGSGKTTVAELFAKAHGYTLVSAGMKFRAWAQERKMTLEAFGKAASADPEIDRKLDREVFEDVLRQDAANRDVIVEGRLQAHLLQARHIPCLKVFIDAPLAVRAKRIAGREKTTAKAAERGIRAREELEGNRYKAIYGIDLADRSVYDLVIDSSDKTPEEIVEIVWSRVAG